MFSCCYNFFSCGDKSDVQVVDEKQAETEKEINRVAYVLSVIGRGIPSDFKINANALVKNNIIEIAKPLFEHKETGESDLMAVLLYLIKDRGKLNKTHVAGLQWVLYDACGFNLTYYQQITKQETIYSVKEIKENDRKKVEQQEKEEINNQNKTLKSTIISVFNMASGLYLNNPDCGQVNIEDPGTKLCVNWGPLLKRLYNDVGREEQKKEMKAPVMVH